MLEAFLLLLLLFGVWCHLVKLALAWKLVEIVIGADWRSALVRLLYTRRRGRGLTQGEGGLVTWGSICERHWVFGQDSSSSMSQRVPPPGGQP